MDQTTDTLAVALFGELMAVQQITKNILASVLPRGMELSHFVLLNHLGSIGRERTPVQLARAFSLSKGAITNTLGRLEREGYVHIRPDWDDARQKLVSISPAGEQARQAALDLIMPQLTEIVDRLGMEKARSALPILRDVRIGLRETT